MAETTLDYGPVRDTEAEKERDANVKVESSIKALKNSWKKMIDSAWEFKQEVFGDDAAEALSFFGSDHSFIWDADPESGGAAKDLKDAPGFTMTYNIVAELVQIFGPYIYHRNPFRQCKPTEPLEFPREAIVDPLLEFQTQQAMQSLQQAMGQAAGPMIDNLVNVGGMNPQEAQQKAMQAVSADPQFAEPQQKIAAMSQELMSQDESYNTMLASQRKSTANKSARALIMQKILNYTPNELGLRANSRKVVDEAIIKGMGVWWTELKLFEDDDRTLVGSFYDSIDNFVSDPDVSDFEDATWVARRRCGPRWQVEKKFNKEPGSLEANYKSRSNTKARARTDNNDAWSMPAYKVEETDTETSNDLIVYWEIYSRMGIGARLKGFPKDIADKIDAFGDYCYIAISECSDYPLNFTAEDVMTKDEESLFLDISWPIPFHKDGQFPCTPLVFHWVPNSPYGMSHVKPGIGELKFLDFAMSHLAAKIETSCTDIIGVLKAAGDDIKAALSAKSKNGQKIIEIEAHYGKSVQELVSVFQRPPMNGDIWQVVAAVAARLDRRLGLNDRVFGMGGTESRSAADSKNRQAAFSIRPEDMANIVEEQATVLARKEALAIAWFMTPKDVTPIVGEEAAFLYEKLIYDQEDPTAIVREYDYRIEANSIRRPSVEKDQEDFAQMTNVALPVLSQYAMSTNNYEPLNEYFRKMSATFPGMEMKINLTPMQPPQPPQPTPEQMEMMRLQTEREKCKLSAQVQQAKNLEAQMLLAERLVLAKMQTSDIDVEKREQLAKLEIETAIEAMEQRVHDAMLQRQLDADEHEQEMKQDREAFEVTKTANKESDGGAKMMTNYRRDYRGYR
jgi:hypothetical protein